MSLSCSRWARACVMLWVALGCSPRGKDKDAGEDGPVCTTPFAGDPSQPVHMELIAMGLHNEVTSIQNGSPIPLMLPPQGGRVSFIGVKADNIDPCTVELTGALVDPVSSQVRLDSRVINLRIADGGMAASSAGVINLWANIPICPNQWAQQNAYGETFHLNMKIRERSGRETTQNIDVVPFCADPEDRPFCECLCQQGYVLGMNCTPASDGGVPDAAIGWDAG